MNSNQEESSNKKRLHISLSRSFYLQNQPIQPFVNQLQSLLSLEYSTHFVLDTSNLYEIASDDL